MGKSDLENYIELCAVLDKKGFVGERISYEKYLNCSHLQKMEYKFMVENCAKSSIEAEEFKGIIEFKTIEE